MKALRDEDEGGLYVYSDENQRIFARFGRPPVPLVPLVLDHNLRNTQQIARAFGPLAPMRMHLRGGPGADVRFVPCAREDAISSCRRPGRPAARGGLAAATRRAADHGITPPRAGRAPGGRRPRRLLALLLGRRRCLLRPRPRLQGPRASGRRALRQREDADRAREMLYVGMSRATDELVVVGDPDFIREIGGDQVAHRLGIG